MIENQEPHRLDAEQWLLREEIDESQALHVELGKHRVGLELVWPRSALAACCFDVSIEHAHAVAQLFETQHDGSGMALVRLVFEAFVRGVWIQVAASPDQVDQLVTDRLHFPKMRSLIAGIETQDEGFKQRTLTALHAASWDAMNSYTHTGMLQISRRIRGDEMARNYATDLIVDALRACTVFALLATQHACLSARRDDRAEALLGTLQALHVRQAARDNRFAQLTGGPPS